VEDLVGSGQRPGRKGVPALRWVPGLAGLSLLLYLLYRVDWASLAGLLSQMAVPPLFLAAVTAFLNLLLAALRFRLLVNAPLEVRRAARVYLTGFISNYLALFPGFGSSVKAGMLWRDRVGLARSVAGVGGEVLLDLLFCVAAGFVFLSRHPGLLKRPQLHLMEWTAPVLAAAALVLLVTLFLAQRTRVAEGVRSLLQAGRHLLRPGVIWKGAVLTAASWSLTAATAALIFSSLGTGAPLADLLGVICLAAFGGLVSLIPAGLGVREGLWAYLLAGAGLGFSVCVLAALCQRLLYLAVALFFWASLENTR